MHSIYFFYHPITNNVRYIGRTINCHNRFRTHLKNINKFKRHPFHCLLQSLHTSGYSKEDLYNCFKIIHLESFSKEEAIIYETKYITEYGIENLCNICADGTFGGDTFTNNPNKELIRNKYKRRIPWNKNKKLPDTTNSGSFKEGNRLLYTIQADNITYRLTRTELTDWIRTWNESHIIQHNNWYKSPYYISTHTFARNFAIPVNDKVVKLISIETISSQL